MEHTSMAEKQEKNKKSILRNTDRITLATKETAKGFRFFDNLNKTEWPGKLSKKYIMTKQIGEGAYGEVRLAFKQGKGSASRKSFTLKNLKMKKNPSAALYRVEK